ncbi:electron transfer flavoprotein beta subunit [Desulfuromonas soudanensis]|uniref:Electron transfer flavoprotein subunit beta n=1 Tax=Desulfuromonas soudanensis TaxID=1603606 RepID=A0A0M4D9T1_9BACT|nr:electron transfer flavoprotein subunit beta/FixA family protein [Desulfuromonas soudanensis]ALC16767.1 electron transfer flavoprotein beta subunit [Desulfuromonas soudanensis]
MKILVCIKQVPDMESKFRINGAGTWYDESDLAWRINEYDEYAVEQGVRLKEQVADAELVVLSIGPDRVKEVIKKALAMGGDRGVHVKDDAAFAKDSFEIASIVAEYAQKESFDVIFTGMQSQDRASAQVGVYLAEMLGLPSVSTIVDFSYADGTVTASRELEGGLKAVVKVATPALFTCQLGLNTPRYPTLPNIMKAKKKELLTVEVAELLKVDERVETSRVYFPERKGGGLVLEGDVGEMADRLIALLKEKTTVL